MARIKKYKIKFRESFKSNGALYDENKIYSIEDIPKNHVNRWLSFGHKIVEEGEALEDPRASVKYPGSDKSVLEMEREWQKELEKKEKAKKARKDKKKKDIVEQPVIEVEEVEPEIEEVVQEIVEEVLDELEDHIEDAIEEVKDAIEDVVEEIVEENDKE